MRDYYLVLCVSSVNGVKYALYDLVEYKSAWDKANEWGKDSHLWLNSNPLSQKDADSNDCWTFVDTNRNLVKIVKLHVNEYNSRDILDNRPGPIASDIKVIHTCSTGSTGSAAPNKPQPVDDAFADSLPVGWNLGGKPITIAELKAYPYDIKDMLDLTEEQCWALVTARLNKRSNYKCPFQRVNGQGVLTDMTREDALEELKAKSFLGEKIREDELIKLEEFINQV